MSLISEKDDLFFMFTQNIARSLSENGYFPQFLRQTQIIILEILKCIPVVIIFAFLDLGKNISFSDTLLVSTIGILLGILLYEAVESVSVDVLPCPAKVLATSNLVAVYKEMAQYCFKKGKQERNSKKENTIYQSNQKEGIG